MSYPNLKLQIHRDQLTWFLDLLLDEKEIFQLSASTGIVPDVDKLYALSRRELLVNLTDAFLGVVSSAKPTLENSDAHTSKPEINNGEASIEALSQPVPQREGTSRNFASWLYGGIRNRNVFQNA